MVMGSRGLGLSPCCRRIPRQTSSNKLSSVGSGRSCSIWSRQVAARYTFKVLYEMVCDTSAQKYCKVREDVGRGEILNRAQNVMNAFNPD